jgi:endonuclease/exonuclease/phosphatase family metal-dependent hydrolase
MVTVLTWNVAGRVRSVADQARALATRPADVLALQEVRASAVAAWLLELDVLGYRHRAFTLAADGAPRAPDRRLGVLIAGRQSLEVCPPLELPWPERHLAVRTCVEGVPLEVHALHAPLSNKPDRIKVRTLEAVYARLAAPSDLPRILAGDLNTPQYESREGEVHTFARTRSGRLRPDYGERHDWAELSLIVGLTDYGYVDAFRSLHGYGRRDRSWLYPNRKTGYRLDHLIVRGLTVESCDYEHAWRDAGLSDHAALWAQLTPDPGTDP